MSFGFSVRVMVLSFLAFGHNANALRRHGGSSSTRPLFAYAKDQNPDFVSPYERSAQPGGFLGSSGSSHSGSGQVAGYSPYGSVSRYVSDSKILRKHNSQQPAKTNPNVNGVFWTNGGNWDLGPQNGISIKSGIASSNAIIMHSGTEPHDFNPGYLPEQPRPQEVSTLNTGYLQKPPRPQQLPMFNKGYLQKLPQELTISNAGYKQSLPRPKQLPIFNKGNLRKPPQELPTSNAGHKQSLPRPKQLPIFNKGYLQKPPSPQQPPTSNTGYLQKLPSPQQLPTSNTGYLQKPPSPQQPPTSNTGYLQKLPSPQQLPTSYTGYLQKPPSPQQLPTSNTGYLQKPPSPQQLPTSYTGYLQKPPSPQQAHSFNSAYQPQKPQQAVFQNKAGMQNLFSDAIVQPASSTVHPGNSKLNSMQSPWHSTGQRPLLPT